MTSILENENVRLFFGTYCHHQTPSANACGDCMAFRIITAMEEPIKKGDKVLVINSDGTISEETSKHMSNCYHPFYLRLPSRFQPSPDKKECACQKMLNQAFEEFEHGEDQCIRKGEFQSFPLPTSGCGCFWNKSKSCNKTLADHETQPPPTPEEVRQGTSGGIYKSSEPYTCTKHMITGCQFCKPHSPNKFDEAVKRSFEEDRIIEPVKVFEKPAEPRKCRDAGIAGHHAARNCDCLCCKPDAPDPAIEALIQQIKLDVYAKVQADATCDMEHLAKQLRELVRLARRSDR